VTNRIADRDLQICQTAFGEMKERKTNSNIHFGLRFVGAVSMTVQF